MKNISVFILLSMFLSSCYSDVVTAVFSLVPENDICEEHTFTSKIEGEILDYYTRELIEGATIGIYDYSKSDQEVVFIESDDHGKFEYSNTACYQLSDYFLDYQSVYHPSYDGGIAYGDFDRKKVFMYRTNHLKVVLEDLNPLTYDEIQYTYKHNITYERERKGFTESGKLTNVPGDTLSIDVIEGSTLFFKYSLNQGEQVSENYKITQDTTLVFTIES